MISGALVFMQDAIFKFERKGEAVHHWVKWDLMTPSIYVMRLFFWREKFLKILMMLYIESPFFLVQCPVVRKSQTEDGKKDKK